MIERIQKLERMVKWLYCKVKNTAIGGIQSIVAGDNITVDNSDPLNPVVSSNGGVITEDSDTVSFTGNGTVGNPLSAESVGGGTSNLTLEQARQNGNVLEGDVGFADGYGTYQIFKTNEEEDFYGNLNFSESGVELNHFNFSQTLSSTLTVYKTYIAVGSAFPNYKGILGFQEFEKQGNRNAFAQLSDVYDANSYSTTEIKTGGTWIDGKPIYRKVLPYTFDSDGIGYLNFSDLNTNTIIHCNALYRSLDGNMCKEYNTFALNSIEYFYSKLSSELPEVTIYLQNIDLTTGFTVPIEPDNSNGFLILEYTKTTDVAP